MMPSGLLAAGNAVGEGDVAALRTGRSSSLQANPKNNETAMDSLFASVLAQSSQPASESSGKATSSKRSASDAETVGVDQGKKRPHHGSQQGTSLAPTMTGFELASAGSMSLPTDPRSLPSPRVEVAHHSQNGQAHVQTRAAGSERGMPNHGAQSLGSGTKSGEVGAGRANALDLSTSPATSSKDGNAVRVMVGQPSFPGTAPTVRAPHGQEQRNVGMRMAQDMNMSSHNQMTGSDVSLSKSGLAPPPLPSMEGMRVLGVTYQSNPTQPMVPPDAVTAAMVDKLVAGKEPARATQHSNPSSGMSGTDPQSVSSLASAVLKTGVKRAQTSEGSIAGISLRQATSRRLGANDTKATVRNEPIWSVSGNGGVPPTIAGNTGSAQMGTVSLSRPDASAQLAAMAANLASSGQGRLQVKVQPEGMGTLVITAAKHADGISVQLVASSSATVGLLSSAASKIQEDMQRLGLQISGVTVSQSQGFSLGNQQQSGAKRQRRGSTGERVLPIAAFSTRTMPAVDQAKEMMQASLRSTISVQA